MRREEKICYYDKEKNVKRYYVRYIAHTGEKNKEFYIKLYENIKKLEDIKKMYILEEDFDANGKYKKIYKNIYKILKHYEII